MKRCANCDLTYPDSSGFCKKCGGPLSDDSAPIQVHPEPNGSFDLVCPNCGKPYRPGAAFCKTCGQPVVTLKPRNVERLSESRVQTGTVTSIVSAVPHPTTQPSASRPITSAEQTVKCAKCGTLNQSGMSFCKSCRAPIGAHAKKIKTNRVLAAVLSAATLFLVAVGLIGWYLWGVKVTIESEPSVSRVAIDGKEVGTTNNFGMLAIPHIRAGEHNLVVMHEGCDDWKQTFNVGFFDFSKTLKIRLNLTKYKLTVVSTPTGSEVLVDNQSMGNTSDSGGALETSPLAPGEYTVVVRHDGYRDWKQIVTLKQDTKLDVSLSSAPVYDSDSSYADTEIRSTLEGWAQSTRNRDVDSHMRFYADTLDYYYNRTLVASSKVRDDRMRAFRNSTG